VPESFILTAGSLAPGEVHARGLVVDESRMRRNLDLTQGLIVAEAVMMGLAPHLGRQNATTLSMRRAGKRWGKAVPCSRC